MKKVKTKTFKSTKGITLIALVVTIIVLLILAGISIAMLTGNNGILTQASRAKKETERAGDKERIQIEVAGSFDKTGKLSASKVIENIEENIEGASITGEEFPLTVQLGNNTFVIDEEGNVELTLQKPTVTDAKVVADEEGKGQDVEVSSQSEGTKLYISFKANMQGGTIKSVTCKNGTAKKTGDLWVTEVETNGEYEFTIVGIIDGDESTTTYKKRVDKYTKRAGIQVGDYIDYTPDVAETVTYSNDNMTTYSGYTGTDYNVDLKRDTTMKWQVLRINEDGSMDIIGTPTTSEVYFEGALGYNNGVYLMNDICKTLYSNSAHNITARSVNQEDMEKWLTDDVKDASGNVTTKGGKTAKSESIKSYISSLTGGTDYIESVDTENNTVKYKKARSYYPILASYENGIGIDTDVKTDGIGASEENVKVNNTSLIPTEQTSKQATSNLTVKQTRYDISINSTNYGAGAKALSNGTPYWVASRYVFCDSYNALFGLRYAYTYTNGYDIFYSISDGNGLYFSLRPIVSLGSEVSITPSTTASSSTGTAHIINW